MIFKCLTCGATEKVKSGMCPKDGPVQTNPMDKEAEELAGIVVGVEGDKEKKVPADIEPKG